MPPETGELYGKTAKEREAASASSLRAVARPQAARTLSATVLFVDLRGYTGLAERLPPAQVAALLDEFFAVLVGATVRHGGQIFSMVGDGMMAGFGLQKVPGDVPGDGARDALHAAQAMLASFAPIVSRWRSELAIETGIGVGLHRGDVALCLHGPPGQRANTLVGDTVNVAARLCSRARAGEVLFSASVAAALQASAPAERNPPDPIPFIQLPQFELRGRTRPLDIWCMPAEERLAL
jgi:adenylate cyclase